jgi:hypothetical protein
VCRLYLWFISADAAKGKEKSEKVLLLTGVSKSAAYSVGRKRISKDCRQVFFDNALASR